MYSVLTVFAAVIAISTAGPTTRMPTICPKPPSVNGATLANLTGALLYVKYYNLERYEHDIDGMAYRFDRQGNTHIYNVTVIRVYYGGSKEEETLIFKEYTADNRLFVVNKTEHMIYYSIPYLEKTKSSVLYTCGYTFDYRYIRQFIQVLTSDLDNDLTEAVEEAWKIAVGSNITELEYKFKEAFLA